MKEYISQDGRTSRREKMQELRQRRKSAYLASQNGLQFTKAHRRTEFDGRSDLVDSLKVYFSENGQNSDDEEEESTRKPGWFGSFFG